LLYVSFSASILGWEMFSDARECAQTVPLISAVKKKNELPENFPKYRGTKKG